MSKTIINVRMCHVEVGQGNAELNTVLGSCIGIGLIWQKRSLCGLAHCLLSKSPDQNYQIGARYVDQALYSLEQLMSLTSFRDVRAVIAGGGNMTMPDTSKPEKMVGHLNAQAAIEGLEQRNIIILKQDIGGNVGRRMTIDCATGESDIIRIPRIGQ